MAYFDRFDICEAHYVFAMYWHVGGETRQRDFDRLHRMTFKPMPDLDVDTLEENGRSIYAALINKERKYIREHRGPFSRSGHRYEVKS